MDTVPDTNATNAAAPVPGSASAAAGKLTYTEEHKITDQIDSHFKKSAEAYVDKMGWAKLEEDDGKRVTAAVALLSPDNEIHDSVDRSAQNALHKKIELAYKRCKQQLAFQTLVRHFAESKAAIQINKKVTIATVTLEVNFLLDTGRTRVHAIQLPIWDWAETVGHFMDRAVQELCREENKDYLKRRLKGNIFDQLVKQIKIRPSNHSAFHTIAETPDVSQYASVTCVVKTMLRNNQSLEQALLGNKQVEWLFHVVRGQDYNQV
jgi:hypothetical protein